MIKGDFGAGQLTSQVSSNMDLFGVHSSVHDLSAFELYKGCESFPLSFEEGGGFGFQQS